jgi:hypothetical protein
MNCPWPHSTSAWAIISNSQDTSILSIKLRYMARMGGGGGGHWELHPNNMNRGGCPLPEPVMEAPGHRSEFPWLPFSGHEPSQQPTDS